jgi:myosin heavy subunit
MNPFTKVDLYSDKVLKSYRKMLMYEMPPHMYVYLIYSISHLYISSAFSSYN